MRLNPALNCSLPLPLALPGGHAQWSRPRVSTLAFCPFPAADGGHVPRAPGQPHPDPRPPKPAQGTCPVFAPTTEHNGTMSIPRPAGRACPVEGAAPTCRLRAHPRPPGGHVQSSHPRVGTMAFCPLPTADVGHEPRTPGPPHVRIRAHPRPPRGHVQWSRPRVSTTALCPFRGPHGGHVQREGAAATCRLRVRQVRDGRRRPPLRFRRNIADDVLEEAVAP